MTIFRVRFLQSVHRGHEHNEGGDVGMLSSNKIVPFKGYLAFANVVRSRTSSA